MSAAPTAPPGQDLEHLRTALVANLVLQGLIIVTGGLVRLTGSGLGCPTWPECTPGSFTPVPHQAEGWHVFVEFGNRLMTFVLTAAAIWVCVAAVRRHLRLQEDASRGLALWSFVPLLGIVAQAVVGGVIVLTKLDPRTVSPHFLLSAALVSFSAWLLVRFETGPRPHPVTVSRPLHVLAYVAAAALTLVVVLGTAVTGSGPHSGDSVENVRFGFDPVTTSQLHSASVWVFVLCLVGIGLLSRRTPMTPTPYLRWWTWAFLLALVEGAVGYLQFFRGLPVLLVASHMMLSAVLVAVVTFAVASCRAPSPYAPYAPDNPAADPASAADADIQRSGR